ncbi:MAG: hypothetical protein GY760_29095 [Deltaproteobacteria bacterium]|nr:hypothetical protein [Deltaproteobacteria bacterium]
MNEIAIKLKRYIQEISSLQDQDQWSIQTLNICRDKYKLSEEENLKLKKLSDNYRIHSADFFKEGKLTKAINSLERAIQINPFSEDLRNTIAQLFLLRAEQEGYKKTDRDLSFRSASICLKLNKSNKTARNIIREISKKDGKVSGRDQNKKLVPIIILVILYGILAIYYKREVIFSFIQKEILNEKTLEKHVITPFDKEEIETKIINLHDDLKITIDKSSISKKNGAYSYTLQGEIYSGTKEIISIDLDLRFKDYNGESLFSKIIPLVKDTTLPEEIVLIDQFFYIHYLPPDIDEVTLNFYNYDSIDKSEMNYETVSLPIVWDAMRPEGIKIEIAKKSEVLIDGYGQSYKKIKIELNNIGLKEIYNLQISLLWKDKYGDILYSIPESLIDKNNPPLLMGRKRNFNILSEIPPEAISRDYDYHITINRIN